MNLTEVSSLITDEVENALKGVNRDKPGGGRIYKEKHLSKHVESSINNNSHINN